MQYETVAQLLLARKGDTHPGVRTRERTWSWDEVVVESEQRAAVALALRADGPFHIGVLLDNVPEFLFWLGGAALSGATIVGINPTRRGGDLAREVRHVDCQLIVTDRAGLALLDGLDLGLDPTRFLVVDEPAYAALLDETAAPPAAAVPDVAVDRDTLMLLLFTSGTTGSSKAVRCTQGRLVDLANRNSTQWGIARSDVCYCCMPLFHGNAIMALWAPAISVGATVALAPKFSASRFLDDVQAFHATFFTYVGKAIAYILATPERPDSRDNDLIRGFGNEASPEDQAAFLERFGCTLIEGYGSSEASGHMRRDPDAPPGALGRPASEAVQVVDPVTLEPCPPAILDRFGRVQNADEAVGEIVDRDAVGRFEGYYKNPEADAERTRDGLYWTGDLGYIDEAGFLYFAGRAGDWVRVDGENLSALHLEQVLRRHPGVVLAGAYAVPDPRSGDQVMAALELGGGAVFDPNEFVQFLDAQSDLPPKGIPRFVRITKALPMTGSNKLIKRQIQAERWSTTDDVYRWEGRDKPVYRLMSTEDRKRLDEEFFASGRQRLLT